jgi:cell wall-associated NlpC family hydrolase
VRVLVIAAALVAVLAPATAAAAAPTPEQIDQQISAQEAKLEQVVEAYNKINIELAASQSQAQQMNDQLRALAGQLDEARTQTDEIAVLAYEGGPLMQTTALLSSGDPQILMGRLTSVAQITAAQQDQLTSTARSKSDHDAQVAKIQAVIADQTTKQQALADQKKQITSDIAQLEALRRTYARAPTPVTAAGPPPYVPGRAGIVVNYAYAQLGKPYVWAAAGPNGFDCSGLTMAAWGAAGVNLPHNAAMQWDAMPHIARSSLQPGDLVFYNALNHVAVYIGSGQIIHAPTFGDHVRIASVDMMAPYGYGRPR